MNIRHILSFIFGIIAALLLLTIVFPANGIKMGNIVFEFPSFNEMITQSLLEAQEDTISTSVEEAVDNQLKALKDSQESAFQKIFANSPLKLYMPDSTYMDALFEALDSARYKHVRIIHYGDSQIEQDRISSGLRELWQHKFGGGGVGANMLCQSGWRLAIKQSTSPKQKDYMRYGSKTLFATHNAYGPFAQFTEIKDTATVTYEPNSIKKYPHAEKYRKVTIYLKGSGVVRVTSKEGETVVLPTRNGFDGPQRLFAVFKQPTNRVTVTFKGRMDVYGVLLDDINGVSVDNVPMRGCSGTIFTAIDRETMKPYFDNENIQLIIMQYGGNSVPYTKQRKHIDATCEQIARQIDLMHELAPQARIMFIGPSDMATKSKDGSMKTYPMLPELCQALKETAVAHNACYWDMFNVMGGIGSMVRWVNANPQLAGGDYIHFTHKGAEKMGALLYETFNQYYKYYRFRSGKELEVLQNDTVTTDVNKLLDIKSDSKVKAKSGLINDSIARQKAVSDSIKKARRKAVNDSLRAVRKAKNAAYKARLDSIKAAKAAQRAIQDSLGTATKKKTGTNTIKKTSKKKNTTKSSTTKKQTTSVTKPTEQATGTKD